MECFNRKESYGTKRLNAKNLEYYPDVFADIINALLYEGKPVIIPETLRPAPTETFYPDEEASLHNQFHDVSQYAMQDNKVKIQYTLENETKTSSKMVLRKAGYEGAVYRGQYKKTLQEIYPVISLVLHWGKHNWKSAKTLWELFQKQNLSDITMNCIDNLQLRVYDMRFLTKEVRQRFTSDMRIVVDYLAEGAQYKPTNQPILHVEAFLLMMRALSNDFRYEWMIQELKSTPKEKGDITMCGLLDKYEARGETKGAERVNKLISLLLKQSRLDDIEKAVNNREYQQMLFEQYGI